MLLGVTGGTPNPKSKPGVPSSATPSSSGLLGGGRGRGGGCKNLGTGPLVGVEGGGCGRAVRGGCVDGGGEN